MKDSNRLAVFALSTLTLVPACSDDDPTQPAAGSSEYLPLTTRDAVLNNLEVAWDNRATDRIDDLLDDDFTFYFWPGDVSGGLPPQWSRADEMAATEGLFTSNTVPPPVGPVCALVRLDLALDEVTWDPIAPPASTLGDVWFTAIVHYTFTFQMQPDDNYTSRSGAQAQLTVREVAAGSGTEWRLVEWRDLENSLVASRQTASVTEATWGAIKALYLDAMEPAFHEHDRATPRRQLHILFLSRRRGRRDSSAVGPRG